MKTLSRDNTDKKDIAKNIFNTTGIPLSYASKLVDDLIAIIIFCTYTKKSLKIKNFGFLSLKKKNKRTGRNPKNKIKYDILERNVLTFKAADKLNKKVNSHVKKKN